MICVCEHDTDSLSIRWGYLFSIQNGSLWCMADEEVPIFLTVDDVVDAHHDIMLTHTPTEPRGIRDNGLLESSVYSPQNIYYYANGSLEDLAAAYLVSIARNHAFEQGNKRVAFVVCAEFLRLNGFQLTLTEVDAIDLTLRVVNGELEREAVADIIANASELIV